MTRARRRRFGSVRRLNRHGRDYLEASYPTPQDAFARWPGLPRRQSRMLRAEYAAELDAWLADAEKRITLGSWTPPQVERAEQERDGITFADYARRWADTHRRADGELVRGSARSKHLEIIELYLIPAFGDRGMRDITARDVQHWWDAFRPVSRHANREKRRLQAYKTLHAIMSSAPPPHQSGSTAGRSSTGTRAPSVPPAPRSIMSRSSPRRIRFAPWRTRCPNVSP